MSALVFGLGLALLGQYEPTAGLTDAALERSLNEDVVGASVIAVSSSGDMLIFDGAITVPAVRPSVEECGVLVSMSPKERPAELVAMRKAADQQAYQRGMSATERMTFVKKSLEPKRVCLAMFKRKCEEIRQRVPLDARRAAVDDARKSIDRLLAESRIKHAIKSYLANVIAECPLEQ